MKCCKYSEASQRIMMNLRPATLDQGLAPAVQWLAASFLVGAPALTLKSIFTADKARSAKEVQLVAFRTAQEVDEHIQVRKCTSGQ
jgi:signal transduction histidine kinase